MEKEVDMLRKETWYLNKMLHKKLYQELKGVIVSTRIFEERWEIWKKCSFTLIKMFSTFDVFATKCGRRMLYHISRPIKTVFHITWA